MAAKEETFRNYDDQQAESYARHRQDYSPALYAAVLRFHESTGGRDALLVDVGCGPGNVTRALGAHFARAIGLDASPSMARHAAALSRGATTKTGAALEFHESAAETLDKVLLRLSSSSPGSADLITAANAAHWFDMPTFWRAAARALRPGGTIALWIPGEGVVHPSTPGAPALDALLRRLVARDLLPYYRPGNLLFRDRYRALPLPWTVDPPVRGFDEAAFARREWAVDDEEAFVEHGDRPVSLDVVEATLGTLSPVTRWREAHPDSAGSERDVVRALRRDMEAVLREHGVEQPGEERVRIVMDGTLLLFKRNGEV